MSGLKTDTPRPFLLLSGAVTVAGFCILMVSLAKYPPAITLEFAVLLVCVVLSELFAFSFPNYSVSLAYPLAMSAIVLGGPAAAGIAAAFGSGLVPDIRRHRPVSILLFNFWQLVLSACLGGWCYVLVGGPVLQQPGGGYEGLVVRNAPAALVGMVAAALLVTVINLFLTTLGVSLYQGAPFGKVFGSTLAFFPTQAALAFVGFLMAEVLIASLFALPLFVFPLIVARQLYQRYAQLKGAYADTVRSLIGALEAKDPYTRGHSERVSQYAVNLGEAAGLGSRELERLEYAALLHDIGKLSVPSAILTKPGLLDEDEMQSIRDHPGRGADMVRRIPPLRDLVGVVQQHHEWIDGTGYPLGTKGDDLSVSARVLSIADSYDAMTTTRSYRRALSREEAIGELLRGSDTQFDSHLVRTFIEARIGLAEAETVAEVAANELGKTAAVPSQG